jgi:siroheme synthase
MGLRQSAAIAGRLVTAGWVRDTPVAVITDASTPRQQVWRGTLEELGADRIEIDPTSAGTIVIGEVVTVSMQATLAAAACGG